ncbi:MAG TPA: hypothetical protein VHH13_00260, partial [Arthrobacter sp.]|nr:hypothetical protein [Arthrobacter sp.]
MAVPVYKERAIFLRDSGDREGSESCLNYARREFHEAKAIAADLKDTDSTKWIDKQIFQLELV